MSHIDLPLILGAALVGVASPGPTTLAIAGTAMEAGRLRALTLATGVTAGSLTWSIAAALGLGAVMMANAWVFEVLRYAGALYLGWLAFRSARSALSPKPSAALRALGSSSRIATLLQGYALHITNPKAILFFASLYSLGVPADAKPAELALVVALVGLQSATIFHGYAVLFSNRRVTATFLGAKRWLDGLFAVAFGWASFKVLTAKLT
ncbi:LysE family translocator [Pinisolibacter sp.]|uniref:LysE family translocator n=1 Tax=Pinisolibacter sp. TaxID=2172024 RepID=UPI002FDCAF39